MSGLPRCALCAADSESAGNNSFWGDAADTVSRDRSATSSSAEGQPANPGHDQAGGPGCDQQRPSNPASAPPHQRHAIGRRCAREERQGDSCCRDHSAAEKETGPTRCRHRHAGNRQTRCHPAPALQAHQAPRSSDRAAPLRRGGVRKDASEYQNRGGPGEDEHADRERSLALPCAGHSRIVPCGPARIGMSGRSEGDDRRRKRRWVPVRGRGPLHRPVNRSRVGPVYLYDGPRPRPGRWIP